MLSPLPRNARQRRIVRLPSASGSDCARVGTVVGRQKAQPRSSLPPCGTAVHTNTLDESPSSSLTGHARHRRVSHRSMKDAGNGAFRSGDNATAIKYYGKALGLLKKLEGTEVPAEHAVAHGKRPYPVLTLRAGGAARLLLKLRQSFWLSSACLQPAPVERRPPMTRAGPAAARPAGPVSPIYASCAASSSFARMLCRGNRWGPAASPLQQARCSCRAT